LKSKFKTISKLESQNQNFKTNFGFGARLVQTKVTIMVVFGFVGAWVLILHPTDVKKNSKLSKRINRHQNTSILATQYLHNVYIYIKHTKIKIFNNFVVVKFIFFINHYWKVLKSQEEVSCIKCYFILLLFKLFK